MEEAQHDCPIKYPSCPYNNNTEKDSFFSKNLSIFIILGISIVGWVYTTGSFSNRITNLESETHDVVVNGSKPTQQALYSTADHAKRITQLESDMRTNTRDISDMKADLKYVVEWVKEQKHLK